MKNPLYVEVASGMPQEVRRFVSMLPETFSDSGEVIYKGRNELRRFRVAGMALIVKAYCLPHLLNRFVYRYFRATKAERAYRYGCRLADIGVGTPRPIGFVTTGRLLLGTCYSVTLESECPFTYRHFKTNTFENRDDILRAIARLAARLHDAGWIHKDFSAGNILFRTLPSGEVLTEVIDLNRMRFHKVGMEEGCANFERLPGTHEMYAAMAEEYAKARGFDAPTCLRLIEEVCGKCTKQ